MGSGDPTELKTTPAHAHAGGGGAPSATYVVTVVEGPDTGLRYTLEGSEGPVLVGQSAVCQLRLTDRQVSRRHLALDLSDRQLRITDLGSTNRTVINGVV